jgi:CPA1 family monovalent cation:H+ antiporter
MNLFLVLVTIVLGVIMVVGFLNEKVFHMTYEIVLLLASILVGMSLLAAASIMRNSSADEIMEGIQLFNLEDILINGILCFMLFAGSYHLKLRQFKEQARPVGVLAFFCTLAGALIYGFLFFGISGLFRMSFTLPACLMFGSIVAPTDPIAATSILKKFGLPEKPAS